MPRQEHDVGLLEALPPGGMRQIELGGEKILLIREGDAVSAVGATCPHAGAPLSQGVLHDGRIICPWHKAAFRARSGDLLEPPAVDPLARYEARVEGGRVWVSTPANPPEAVEPGADGRCFVIVGGGAAGAVAAQTLRQAGFGGRLLMLDQENRVPYDRTLLSKYFLSGEEGAEKSPLQSQAFYRQHRIERRTAQVVRVDPQAHDVICSDGTPIHYDAALLATGGAPVPPSLPGADSPNVFLLRTRGDADAILARAEQSERAVVLGASFIGMEVAASLRERGLDVTVIGQEAAPFEKQLGAEIGSVFTRLHQGHGVVFRLGQKISRIEAGQVVLETGEKVPADLVIIGFGVKPSTGYLDGVTLNEDGGVPVDANLRAAPDLFAAGDIACFPLRGDSGRIRVEHWRVAEQQGRVAALNMLGQSVRYDAVPVFWTIQYLKRLDYVGHAKEWDDVVVHGDLLKPEFIAYYVKEGHVVAAVGLDRDRDTAALIALFTRQRDWTPEALGSNPAALLGS